MATRPGCSRWPDALPPAWRAALVVALLALEGDAVAAEPPATPMLRVVTEAPNHPPVSSPGGRFVLAPTVDRTIGIWRGRDLRLLKILRPPLLESSNEGVLLTADISPDGTEVAAGGYTGMTWDRASSIYIFDARSGAMKRRVTGLTSNIEELRWSPDGRWIVARYGAYLGLIDAGLGRLVDEHDGYEYARSGLDISSGNAVAAAAYDRFLRLYAPITDGRLRLVAKKQNTELGGPWAWPRFSPDGKLIAVSGNTQAIHLLSADDLSVQHKVSAPRQVGTQTRFLWSPDQRYLYAASTGCTNVVRWDEGGKGHWTIGPPRCGHIAAAPDRRIAVWGREGWTILRDDLTEEIRAGSRPSVVAVDQNLDHAKNLAVSHDGTAMSWRLDTGQTLAFSLADRAVRNASAFPAPGTALASYTDPLVPTKITRDKGTQLGLGGATFAVAENVFGVFMGHAFVPGSSDLVIVQPFRLGRITKQAAPVWGHRYEGALVRAAAVSGDGRFVVAAFTDGSIRWLRADSGATVASFIARPDQRWAMWTPAGYYLASPGGEDLLGWHVNRGRDQSADYYPASRLRATFHRPDLVVAALTGSGVAAPPAEVAPALPPIVEVVTPEEGAAVTASTVPVRVAVRAPVGAPVTAVRVRVNGRLAAAAGADRLVGAASAGREEEIAIAVPAADSEIMVFAENRHGVSAPAAVAVKWSGPAVAAGAAKPKLHLLAVGVSRSPDPARNLAHAAKHAQELAASMRAQRGRLYRDVSVAVLTDVQATRASVLTGLARLVRGVSPHDVVMLYLSGHGASDAAGVYHYLPENADVAALSTTAVSILDIRRALTAIAGRSVVVIDTTAPDLAPVVNELASPEHGLVVFAAAGSDGAFSRALLDGIAGKADAQGTGRVTHRMLDAYVVERVPAALNPAARGVPDFALAVAPVRRPR